MRHLFASILVCAPLFAGQAGAQGLTVTVENIRNDRGNIVLLVFDDARAFDRLNYMKAADYAEIPARPGKVEARFPRLDSGPYAVFVFHDENLDQDINYKKDRLLEGIGATGAPEPDDNPSFRDAAVPAGRATVILHYDQ